jgi:hypothetical protein
VQNPRSEDLAIRLRPPNVSGFSCKAERSEVLTAASRSWAGAERGGGRNIREAAMSGLSTQADSAGVDESIERGVWLRSTASMRKNRRRKFNGRKTAAGPRPERNKLAGTGKAIEQDTREYEGSSQGREAHRRRRVKSSGLVGVWNNLGSGIGRGETQQTKTAASESQPRARGTPREPARRRLQLGLA